MRFNFTGIYKLPVPGVIIKSTIQMFKIISTIDMDVVEKGAHFNIVTNKCNKCYHEINCYLTVRVYDADVGLRPAGRPCYYNVKFLYILILFKLMYIPAKEIIMAVVKL